MVLKHLTLQNFRNYTKSNFDFSPRATIVIGSNAIGKSNLIEALFLLATGKSFRTDKDKQLLQFGKNLSRVKGSLQEAEEKKEPKETEELEIIFSETPTHFLQKKYLINGVSKRRIDFAGQIKAVLFTPVDLDIVSGQPGNRRKFLDEILEQTDLEYAQALLIYGKGLRQRNALLEQVQKTGVRNEKVFTYWDDLLIKNGQLISRKRKELIEYINKKKKEVFDFSLVYDESTISQERLLQYKQAEVGAGVTLVGPHRDDIVIKAPNRISGKDEEVRYFGSRGQQRLVSLELKLCHIALLKEKTETDPVLLLDDIFSELDEVNIQHVLSLMNMYQTIATTTHEEFVGKHKLTDIKMIELGK
jgi:DNA replication and repair protein RecF